MMMVKGKVQNGVIEVIAVMNGRVVGYKKPLHSKLPVSAPIQDRAIEVDSPFLHLVHENHKRHAREKEARLKALY